MHTAYNEFGDTSELLSKNLSFGIDSKNKRKAQVVSEQYSGSQQKRIKT